MSRIAQRIWNKPWLAVGAVAVGVGGACAVAYAAHRPAFVRNAILRPDDPGAWKEVSRGRIWKYTGPQAEYVIQYTLKEPEMVDVWQLSYKPPSAPWTAWEVQDEHPDEAGAVDFLMGTASIHYDNYIQRFPTEFAEMHEARKKEPWRSPVSVVGLGDAKRKMTNAYEHEISTGGVFDLGFDDAVEDWEFAKEEGEPFPESDRDIWDTARRRGMKITEKGIYMRGYRAAVEHLTKGQEAKKRKMTKQASGFISDIISETMHKYDRMGKIGNWPAGKPHTVAQRKQKKNRKKAQDIAIAIGYSKARKGRYRIPA